MDLGKTFKSASFHSQPQKAYGSMNDAQIAKTKPRPIAFKNPATSAIRCKQSLTAQRATRRAQKSKPNFKTQRVGV